MADLKAFLYKLHENLNILREREAKYAGNAPLELLNQIEDHQKAIALTQQIIAGELTEDEWHEATRPLLLAVHNGRVVNLTEVDTGGGAYVPGPVNIGRGDFVGRDQMSQVAIGQGIIQVGQVSGSGTASVSITHSHPAPSRPSLYRKILRKEPLSYPLILTEKALTFREGIYQLNNLTNIRKHKLSREAKDRIPVSIWILATIAFLTCVYILTYTPFTTDWYPVGVCSIAIAIIALVVVGYAVVFDKIKQVLPHFA